MARIFPTSIIQAMTAQTTDKVILTLLDISHPKWGNVYIVNNTEAVTSLSQVYSPFPFSVILPPDSEELQPVFKVKVVNVTRLLVQEMRKIAGSDTRALCTVKIIEAASPSSILWEWSDFELANLSYNEEMMNFDLIVENFLSEPFPSQSITPANFPGCF